MWLRLQRERVFQAFLQVQFKRSLENSCDTFSRQVGDLVDFCERKGVDVALTTVWYYEERKGVPHVVVSF